MKPPTTTSPQPSPRPGHLRAEAGPRPRRLPASGAPLSKKQLAVLCQEAAAAFAYQEKLGLAGATPGQSRSAAVDDFRRAQLAAAGFPASLRSCGNHHYRPIRAHFQLLAGADDKAFANHLRSGQVKDHGAADDTHEKREELRALLLRELLAHGARVTPGKAEFDESIAATVREKGGMIEAGYIIALAKAKANGRHLDSLTAGELRQIHWTLRNRIAAREGRGTTAGRNKSQRKKTTTP